MRKKVYILGAGGHAKVIAEIIQLLGHELHGFIDDDHTLIGQKLMDFPILGPISNLHKIDYDGLVIGIGHNESRSDISQRLSKIDDNLWVKAHHPNAIISPDSQIGLGTMIIAGAIINIHTQIGDHCIINTGATIDHDCVVDDYTHIGPGAHLAGSVKVGKGAFIATGANIVPGCTIGDWSIVGAGATVIRDVPSYTTVVGIPAKPLRTSNSETHSQSV